jgi:putative chitinase
MVNKINIEQLQAIYKEAPKERLLKFVDLLNSTFDEFDISTPQEIAMFLAQVGHESGQLRYLKELASGEAYEGRQDLGNTSAGDGVRYKGRGLIQITGKRNYVLCSLGLDLPLLETPQLLEEPVNAVRSAGWFWWQNRLKALGDDIKKVTRRINGGYNGLEDRIKLYERAKAVLVE